jgi:hypothetical protein
MILYVSTLILSASNLSQKETYRMKNAEDVLDRLAIHPWI